MELRATHDKAGNPYTKDVSPAPIIASLDEPADKAEVGDFCRLSGWVVSSSASPVTVRALYEGRRAEVALGVQRDDVYEAYNEDYPSLQRRCGFLLDLDLRKLPKSLQLTLQIEDGELVAESKPIRLSRKRRRDPALPRADYKETWNAASGSQDFAKLAVAGTVDEALLTRAGDATVEILEQMVGVRPDDVFLEIGCGVGRVGAALAPRCKQWIGTDASENMCAYTAKRLSHLPNVETVPISGWDLAVIPSASVDVVYSTVVFMHIDEWERFSYVSEGMRVLRPGGRMFADAVDLTSDPGWALFRGVAQSFHPMHRPSQVSKCSTPDEMRAYFERAGFQAITQRREAEWVMTAARKPALTSP